MSVGAVQLTVAEAFPPVAVTPVGAPGTLGALGITALDADESGPVPLGFVADTLNVYVVPFVSPVTVVEVAGGLPVTVTGVCAVVPTYGVTVYLVSVLPPLLVGAIQLTVAWPLPAVAVTPVGAPGRPFGVTALDADESGPVPFAVVADTLNVYAVPFVRPVTVVEVAGGLPVTVTGVCALVPMYGVTVYLVIVLPAVVGRRGPAHRRRPVAGGRRHPGRRRRHRSACVSATSSTYIQLSSGLADWSLWALNQSTTF